MSTTTPESETVSVLKPFSRACVCAILGEMSVYTLWLREPMSRECFEQLSHAFSGKPVEACAMGKVEWDGGKMAAKGGE